ncbi:HAMP domain-containing histidine kinase [[Clostridium] hylemonae]|uniref:sensor histidine kinase n=1 Tax=[Clostridium] hylemonae TaxID=89153 RepID=UPI001D060A5E|nr:HAMP domain-containing sensor histidine kinase [[Clostridium] hylemonae]MCB7520984.1 HAMP domain-containing histidine kinase [[Clostridium] hylemonae]
MAILLCALTGMLIITVILLFIKIRILQKSAAEISKALADRLETETNILIDLSSRDPYMSALAETINVQLRKLREERQRFQQGDRNIKEAITNISHDIRTPLTAICGYLELLEREEMSEEVRRCLCIIQDRADVLNRLAEELFCYSVTTSAPFQQKREAVSLNSILAESISAYYAVLKGSRITPDIHLPESAVMRSLDKNALYRIFGNIIGNAVKYSDGDLTIKLDETGGIVFSNHASKLNELQAGRLLDRYYTVEAASRSTGLGLSIAKTLTEQMGGSIRTSYAAGTLSILLHFP